MQLIVLIIALLASLVLGSPPPLNNFDFLGNATHTTADLIDAATSRLGVAWTDMVTVGSNPHTRWPRNPLTQYTSIYACYKDQQSYTSLHYFVKQGSELWEDKLGMAGEANGYSVHLFRIIWDEDPWCYYEPEHPKAGQWNPKFRPDAFVIRNAEPSDGDVIAYSITGYSATGKEGRHQLVVNTGAFDF